MMHKAVNYFMVAYLAALSEYPKCPYPDKILPNTVLTLVGSLISFDFMPVACRGRLVRQITDHVRR